MSSISDNFISHYLHIYLFNQTNHQHYSNRLSTRLYHRSSWFPLQQHCSCHGQAVQISRNFPNLLHLRLLIRPSSPPIPLLETDDQICSEDRHDRRDLLLQSQQLLPKSTALLIHLLEAPNLQRHATPLSRHHYLYHRRCPRSDNLAVAKLWRCWCVATDWSSACPWEFGSVDCGDCSLS